LIQQLASEHLTAILFIRRETLLFLSSSKLFFLRSFWFTQTGIFLQTKISTIFMHDKKKAVQKAVASAAQSVLVSGLGFFAATYGVGLYSNVDIISSMCRLIARGALMSVAVVLLLLPAMLLVLDKVIVHTTFDLGKNVKA